MQGRCLITAGHKLQKLFYFLLAKREEPYPEFYPISVSLASACPLFSCSVGRGGSRMLRAPILSQHRFHPTSWVQSFSLQNHCQKHLGIFGSSLEYPRARAIPWENRSRYWIRTKVRGAWPPLLAAGAYVRVRKGQVEALLPVVLFQPLMLSAGGGFPALGVVSISLRGFFLCIFFLLSSVICHYSVNKVE